MGGNGDVAGSPLDMGEVPSDSQPDASVSTAAIYARTSSTKSDRHYSIDEQVRRCWNHCQQHGWDVSFVFTDEGQTGRNTERSGFQDMIDQVTRDVFDIVVFWKLDRFAESVVGPVNTK